MLTLPTASDRYGLEMEDSGIGVGAALECHGILVAYISNLKCVSSKELECLAIKNFECYLTEWRLEPETRS